MAKSTIDAQHYYEFLHGLPMIDRFRQEFPDKLSVGGFPQSKLLRIGANLLSHIEKQAIAEASKFSPYDEIGYGAWVLTQAFFTGPTCMIVGIDENEKGAVTGTVKGVKLPKMKSIVEILKRENRPRPIEEVRSACNDVYERFLDSQEFREFTFAVAVAFDGVLFSHFDWADAQYFTPVLLILRNRAEMVPISTCALRPYIHVSYSEYYNLQHRFKGRT